MTAPAAGTMTAQIAAAIEEWAKGRDPWTQVPDNAVIGARLDFTASDGTFLAAKRSLVIRGVLVRSGRRYCVA